MAKINDHLPPKRMRTRRTATGKAVECTGRSSDPQSDQAPMLCQRYFSVTPEGGDNTKPKLFWIYWLDIGTTP